MKHILFFALSVLLSTGLQAQSPAPGDSLSTGFTTEQTGLKGNPSPFAGPANGREKSSLLDEPELLNSFAILLFAAGFFLMLFFAKPMLRFTADQHMKIILLALVVFAALYLTAAGWNSEQNAPAFGVLGAVLGYLMGKTSANSSPPENT